MFSELSVETFDSILLYRTEVKRLLEKMFPKNLINKMNSQEMPELVSDLISSFGSLLLDEDFLYAATCLILYPSLMEYYLIDKISEEMWDQISTDVSLDLPHCLIDEFLSKKGFVFVKLSEFTPGEIDIPGEVILLPNNKTEIDLGGDNIVVVNTGVKELSINNFGKNNFLRSYGNLNILEVNQLPGDLEDAELEEESSPIKIEHDGHVEVILGQKYEITVNGSVGKGFGANADSSCKISIIGSAEDALGLGLKGATITVKGSIGNNLGTFMESGKILVEPDPEVKSPSLIGHSCGLSMFGGEIRINDKDCIIGNFLGANQQGGFIDINAGVVGQFIGMQQKEGNISINAKFVGDFIGNEQEENGIITIKSICGPRKQEESKGTIEIESLHNNTITNIEDTKLSNVPNEKISELRNKYFPNTLDEQFTKGLRRFIKEHLRSYFKSSWGKKLFKDIPKLAEKYDTRKKNDLRKWGIPEHQWSYRYYDITNTLDPFDFLNIIEFYWETIFQQVFKGIKLRELRRRIKDFNDFRNDLDHWKEIDKEIKKKELLAAEASYLDFKMWIEPYLEELPKYSRHFEE